MQLRGRVIEAVLQRHARLRPLLPRGYHAYWFPGGRIYLDLREGPSMLARALYVYERHKTRALLRCLPRGGVFLDVGGNKGDFTFIAAKHLAGTGRVVCLEPEPENFAWLQRSLERNGYRNVELIEAAFGAEPGEATLFLGPRSGMHSLVDRHMTVGSVTVPVFTVDDLLAERGIDHVDVMKIDVEGGEVAVLAGARGLLESGKPMVLLLDLHPEAIDPVALCQQLQDHGFSLRTPYDVDRALPQLRPNLTEVIAVRGPLPAAVDRKTSV